MRHGTEQSYRPLDSKESALERCHAELLAFGSIGSLRFAHCPQLEPMRRSTARDLCSNQARVVEPQEFVRLVLQASAPLKVAEALVVLAHVVAVAHALEFALLLVAVVATTRLRRSQSTG